MPSDVKSKTKLSDFGDGPEDSYIVFGTYEDTIRFNKNNLQTGCFVLRPGKEKPAFLALRDFEHYLKDEDPRKEKLRNWIKRLEKMWS